MAPTPKFRVDETCSRVVAVGPSREFTPPPLDPPQPQSTKSGTRAKMRLLFIGLLLQRRVSHMGRQVVNFRDVGDSHDAKRPSCSSGAYRPQRKGSHEDSFCRLLPRPVEMEGPFSWRTTWPLQPSNGDRGGSWVRRAVSSPHASVADECSPHWPWRSSPGLLLMWTTVGCRSWARIRCSMNDIDGDKREAGRRLRKGLYLILLAAVFMAIDFLVHADWTGAAWCGVVALIMAVAALTHLSLEAKSPR